MAEPVRDETARWELYKALAEPLRLRLLALAAEEELSVGELSELTGESQSNVSRQVAPLRDLGLLAQRRQGTRSLLQLAADAQRDPVVADALGSGRQLILGDGSLARVAAVVAQREAAGRAFFGANKAAETRALPLEMAPYMAALTALLPRRELAVDAGTGDGGLLEVLAPGFAAVLAFDREEARIAEASRRVQARGFGNVTLCVAEPKDIDAKWVGKADVVFAVRMLHHAAKPGELVKRLARLCAPFDAESGSGGALVIVDYAHHDDESMREQADLWLGFEPRELQRFAEAADLEVASISPVPAPSAGPDAHLPWQVLVARAGRAGKRSDRNSHRRISS